MPEGHFLEAIKASTTQMDECDVVVPRDRVADFIKYTHEVAGILNLRIPSFGPRRRRETFMCIFAGMTWQRMSGKKN